MKKLIITTVVLALFSVMSYAQRGSHMIDRMVSSLELSTDQEVQLKEKFESFKKEMQALRPSEATEAKRDQMKGLKKSFHKEVESLLTKDQLEQFHAMKSKKGPHRMRGMKKGHKAGHKSAMKAELMPIVKSQRTLFEKELSKKDKKSIEKLRVEFATLKEAKRTEMKNAKMEFARGERPSKELKEEMKEAHRKEKEAFMNSGSMKLALALVDKYEDEIKEYVLPIKEAKDKLVAKRKEACEGKCTHNRQMKKGNAFRKKGGEKMQERKAMHEKMRLVKFLLFDPEVTNIEKARLNRPIGSINEINSFPNPAINTNTLSYTLKERGMVEVELWDGKGNRVRSIEKDMKEAGTHEVQVSVGDLSSGLYYYTIKDQNGAILNKQFIKTK